jgi:hypothetical protein
MSAEEEIRNAVGGLVSGTGARTSLMTSIPSGGPETVDEKISALERDVRGLYEALLVAGHQIDDLRGQMGVS